MFTKKVQSQYLPLTQAIAPIASIAPIIAIGAIVTVVGIIIMSLSLIGCNSVSYQGKVAVKGNEPFTYVALVEGGGTEYSIIGPLKIEIREKYQGRYLKVQGRIIRPGPSSGSPSKPGPPVELEVLEILEVRNKPF